MTSADLMNDYLIWDNRESVSHISVRNSGNVTTSVSDAKRRALSFKEVVSAGGAYVSNDLVWLLPVAVLNGATPKPADKIVDSDAVSWTILDASLNTWRTWYRCTCRSLVLAYDLRDTATLMRPTNNQDLAGGRVPSYAAAVSDVPVKVQEAEASVEERFGKRQGVRRFTAYVGDRLYPQANDRLVTSDGTIYQITAWRNAGNIDVLMELDLEIVQ
mgnify:CR=1 FL=1